MAAYGGGIKAHGANRDIDTTAEQIFSTATKANFGIIIKADSANAGIVYIGGSTVTAGDTDATDGYPLSAGESVTIPIEDIAELYAIASTTNQIVYYLVI